MGRTTHWPSESGIHVDLEDVTMNATIAGILFTVLGAVVHAAVQTMEIECEDGGTTLTGVLYWDDTIEGPHPGALEIHE